MPAKLRCAIYTRKSSEEGLEQGFNSLHAQREACEAYVLSQAGEGWTALPTIYNDGGYSGGSMDRPALQQLLADISRGLIDVVVVYKVDRLTRSLSDFARIVEAFDNRSVSFVSVTQAFNTTTSMGRLTLNVLLSFAQFEREVTGERIRDKISASKAKGMWMGGNLPLGYDLPTDLTTRALVVNEAEAETVRFIFERYLELGTVRRLAEDLRLRGILTKQRTSGTGRALGGRPWLEGPLYYFLKNRIYRGEIRHKGKVYPGRQPAIVDEDVFEAVQRRLASAAPVRSHGPVARAGSLLVGRIFDDAGHPMSPVSSRRSGRLHRYYVSQATIRGDRGEAGSLNRVPAETVEMLVDRELRSRVDPAKVSAQPLAALVKAVVSEDGVELTLDASKLRLREIDAADPDAPVVIRVRTVLKTFGGAKRLLDEDGATLQLAGPDIALQKVIARGRRWEAQLASGERCGADDIAAAEGLQSRYLDKVLKFAWLAPDIVEAILAGRRLRGFTLTQLIETKIPMDWRRQRAMLVVV